MQKLRLLRTLFIMMHEEAADMLFGTANAMVDGRVFIGKTWKISFVLLFKCSQIFNS